MSIRDSFFLCIIGLILSSCAAYQLDSAQDSLRSSFAQQNYAGSIELLSKFQQKKIYKGKDDVLLNLEQGMANHFARQYSESNSHFTQAENRIDYLYSKSVTRAIKSFITNDNALDYDGEDYEDVYLNIFKTLNYIHMEELESALVESRRIAHKLGQLDLKYNDLVDALSKADTTGKVSWETGNTNVQNSALGRYLSTILFAKTNKPDDARIEYQNLMKAFREQPSVYAFQTPSGRKMRRLTRPDQYNVLVTGFSGRAPQKVQNDLRIYLDEADLYLKFSVPSLNMYQTQVDRVEVVVGNKQAARLDLIEEMDVVAREVYSVKAPIIYARSVVRAFLKAAGTNALSKEISKEHEVLGEVANILGKIGQEATEKADLRGWQTMPGKAYATVLNLSPGEHDVVTNYYGDGRLLYSQTNTISIEPDEQLELVESLYWN